MILEEEAPAAWAAITKSRSRSDIACERIKRADAAAFDIEFPAVIDAAQTALLVAAIEHRRAAMRTISVDQSDLAVGIAKRD